MKKEIKSKKSNKWVKEHKKIIWNIVVKERDKLKVKEKIEFEWGRKRFVLRRIR